MGKRQIKMNVGLTYDTHPDTIRTIVKAVETYLDQSPLIDQSFKVVNFNDFSESSLDIFIYCYSTSAVWAEYLKTRETVHLDIMDIVHRNGASFAFPSRSLYLENGPWKTGDSPFLTNS